MARRRRSAGDCPLDQCRIIARRRLTAFDHRRPGRRRRQQSAASRELFRQLMTWGLSMTSSARPCVSSLPARWHERSRGLHGQQDRVCEIASVKPSILSASPRPLTARGSRCRVGTARSSSSPTESRSWGATSTVLRTRWPRSPAVASKKCPATRPRWRPRHGFYLRAALDALPPTATVVVAELVPAVVGWNRGPLGPLAGQPLDDPRVTVQETDVAVPYVRTPELSMQYCSTSTTALML